MKRRLLFVILTLWGVTLMAHPVDQRQAVRVAQNFVAQRVKAADTASAAVVYTHVSPKSGEAAIYAVNVGGAFVLVSADDVAHPVLGYSFSRPWPAAPKRAGSYLPSQVSGYLDDLANQIAAAVQQSVSADAEIVGEWQELMTLGAPLAPKDVPDSVGPLLTTTWDQGQYYNAMCPEDDNGPDGHVYTGCVATAMAQIINYWGYPVHGRGSHSYDVSGLDPGSMCEWTNITGYGVQYVDFENSMYDYANMPENLYASSTPQEVLAVSQLMYHCGVSVSSFYDASGTAAYAEDVRGALISYFGFASSLGYANRQLYTDVEWEDSLRANIDRGEPVFYSGSNLFSSHAFVLDGYMQGGFFHFNFGWSGDCDGWYLTKAINVGFGYNEWQSAIMGIVPESNTHSVICHRHMGTQNRDVFKVIDKIHIRPLRGGSEYRAANEMTGASINMSFAPNDSTRQLMLDVLDFDAEQSVVIYDGINKDSLIRVIETRNLDDYSTVTFRNWLYDGLPSDTIFQNRAGTDFSPILSTRHGFSVVVYSYGGQSEGFRLQVRNETDTTSIDTTTTNGIVYWTDVVRSEPEGYYVDGDTIRITTPEGLAWVAYCMDSFYVNWTLSDAVMYQYDHHVISIENDLDLSGYYWSPIRMWFGDVEGHGHTISDMHVNTSRSGGLFASLWNNEISNIGLLNANVNAVSEAGPIAGNVDNCTVKNCYSEAHIVNTGNGKGGGLIGSVNNSRIINCYAYGDVYAQMGYGGLVGYCNYSEVKNCVTQVGDGYDWGYRIIPNEWRGLFTEEVNGGTFSNCFSDISLARRSWTSTSPEYDLLAIRAYFLGNVYNVDAISNLAAFNILTNSTGIIISDTAVNYTLGDNMDVITALNDRVVESNSSDYRIWIRDSVTHLPVFGGYYEVTCPNVSNITAENIVYNDGFAVALSWQENGDANEWQIKYNIKNAPEDSSTIISVLTTKDTLENLSLGNEYCFYVRPICGQDTVGWGESVGFYVDKKRWIEVVTSRPEGYIEDSDGNVTISSPEGLAWIAKQGGYNSFEGKTISIANDLDMGAYRWTPINSSVEFRGILDGNNHVISNLYCSENINNNNSECIGFIGRTEYANIKNVILKDGFFSGHHYVGGLVGYAWNSTMVNCHVINADVRGVYLVGGLGGVHSSDGSLCETYNCSASGSVHADQSEGGIWGGYTPLGIINNCYSNCNIMPLGVINQSFIGGLVGGAGGTMLNCYSVGDMVIATTNTGECIGSAVGGYNPEILGGLRYIYAQHNDSLQIIGHSELTVPISDTSSIINGNLQTSVTIGGVFYTNLLDALNAWVDANDSAGVYRHWAADVNGENGGFPVFAPVPCTPATGSDSVVVCDSYTLNGVTYTNSGTVYDTLVASDGCDSIVTIQLTVNHSTSSIFTVRACDEYTWHRYTYTESTDEPTYTMVGSNECDSTVNLHLTINHSSSGVETVTACNSYVWHDREYTESTDTATFYMPNGNAVGCDSTVTLNLTINRCSTTTLTVCDSYTWTSGTGLTYYESGEYYSGEDTLVLTVYHPVHTAMTEAACDGYSWNGTDYAVSGDYTYSHEDGNGCMQVDTLHLTINHSVHTSATETECDTYSWNGTTFNASGDYTYSYVDANGCTQVDTLHLTINHSAETVVTDSAENSYTWNGVTYTESGTYTWVGLTAEGCDSTVTLQLTVETSQEGIYEADASATRIYAVGSRIVVDGAEGNPVYLYNAIGQLIKSQRKEEDGVMVIEVPAAGVYMVKVGAYPARKVVVIR